jgi:hypothetical protein
MLQHERVYATEQRKAAAVELMARQRELLWVRIPAT